MIDRLDEIEKIRKALVECAKANPEQFMFHITSDLNWHRYCKKVEFISKLLQKEARVLDIGCSLGQTTAMMASIHPNIIIGLDLRRDPTWKELKSYGAKFVVGDALNLPFKDRQFDATISFGVMEHV